MIFRAPGGAPALKSAARLRGANVVRQMFADMDTDVYIMADGDGTYDPASAPPG